MEELRRRELRPFMKRGRYPAWKLIVRRKIKRRMADIRL
jgi:hypothetical protein